MDSPEAFGRPQTVHHGTPSLKPRENANVYDREKLKRERVKFERRVHLFFKLLHELYARDFRLDDLPDDIGESYLAMTLDRPMTRHTRPTKQAEKNAPLNVMLGAIKSLRGRLKELEKTGRLRQCLPKEEDQAKALGGYDGLSPRYGQLMQALLIGGSITLVEDDPLLTTLLSFFRRPRSILGLRSILLQSGAGQDSQVTIRFDRQEDRKTIKAAEITADFWCLAYPRSKANGISPRSESAEHGERPIEGGLLWIPRLNHNASYSALAKPTHPDFATDVRGEAPRPEILLRLLLLAIVHRRIARYYFSELYASSGDLSAFREYIYHRVSSLRYLARVSLYLMHWQRAVTHWENMVGDKLAGWNKDAGPFPPDQLAWWTKAIFDNVGLGCRAFAGGDFGTTKILLRELAGVRLRELQAFRATLSRELAHARMKSYAGTWLAWLDRLQLDADEILEDSRENEFDQLRTECADPFLLLAEEVGRLRRDLEVQSIRFLEEKGDWDGTLEEVLRDDIVKQIRAILHRSPDETANTEPRRPSRLHGEEILRNLLGVPSSKLPIKVNLDLPPVDKLLEQLASLASDVREPDFSERVEIAKSLLDVEPGEFVDCYVSALRFASGAVKLGRLLHLLTVMSGPLTQHKTGIVTLAENVLSRLKAILSLIGTLERPDQNTRMYSERIREYLRGELDKADLDHAVLKSLAAFDHANPWLDLDEEKRPRRDDSRVYAAEMGDGFLTSARRQALFLQEKARLTVFESRGDYNLYRARSLLVVARSIYLQADLDCDFSRSLSWLHRASRLLSESGEAHVLERVGVLRARAECRMLWADLRLARAANQRTTDAWRESVRFCRNQLELARSALTRAVRIYEGRKRNVLWWLRLSRDLSQWSIEAAVLSVVGFPTRTDPGTVNPGVLIQTQTPRTDVRHWGGADMAFERFEEILGFGLTAIHSTMNSIQRATRKKSQDQLTFAERASLEEWRRSVGQWLCLLAVTYWHDALQYLAVVNSAPRSLNTSKSFWLLFWDRWESLNKAHRLHEMVAEIRHDLRLALPGSSEVWVHLKDADRLWDGGNGSPDGWLVVRQGVLDTMRQLCQPDKSKDIKLKEKLYDQYFI
jgi:hypothetical protein